MNHTARFQSRGVGRLLMSRRSQRLHLAVEAKAAGFGKLATTIPKDLQVPKDAPTVTKLEWAKPLTLVKYPDPRLRAVNAKVTVFDDTLMELVKEMIPIMYEDDGVGLAAPQVGVNIRLMVFNPDGRTKPGNERVLVNPEIISVGKERVAMTEGCLSFPELNGDVERPRDITVRAQNEKGETITLELVGTTHDQEWVSRIFQHEYDHLQGILFHDRMKASVFDRIRNKLIALEDGFLAQNPGVPIVRTKPKPKGFGLF